MFNQRFEKKFLFHHESQCYLLTLGLDPARSCKQAGIPVWHFHEGLVPLMSFSKVSSQG